MFMSDQLRKASEQYANHAVNRPTVELVVQVVQSWDEIKKLELQKRSM